MLDIRPVSEPLPVDLSRVRVLIPTSRRVYRLVSYGMVVDFEDAVATASDADLVPVPLHSRRGVASALLSGRPQRSVTPPRSRYDICLLVAMSPAWLPSLRYIRGLRQAARRVAVYLFDSWLSDLPALRTRRRVWSLIDDLFVSFHHALGPYSEQLPCRVHYLPQAIDPRWFHPYRENRPIDVLSVGRRLREAHQHLLAISRQRDLFYYYQTHAAPLAIDLSENQELLGRLCQLSRVHVSWPVDRTNPVHRDEGAAITARWFESAACGATVIGSAPPSDDFEQIFPFAGFVRELDPHTPQSTEAVLNAAMMDPQDRERQALADYVLRTHTWDVRWRQIVEACTL